MKNFIKRTISLLLVTVFCITILQGIELRKAYGASKYVTRGKMIEMIVKELGVKSNQTSPQPYIEAAKKIGLITDKLFTKYDVYATKMDVAILLVRADEYLNGETITSALLNEIIDQRISDIRKVKKVNQSYLAKAYALGYIKGSSNGVYSKDRKMNPTYKVTVTYAKQLVSFINNKGKRHQISPDGQLIRTTNMPEFAEYYPYILDSYPNEYYDWEFMFMKYRNSKGTVFGTQYYKSLIDYAAPVDFIKYRNSDAVWYSYINKMKITSKELYSLCSKKWEKNAYKYLDAVFNVDYRTIKNDKKWYKSIIQTYWGGEENLDIINEHINEYIDLAIKNKTIIKSSIIGVDKSSLYIDMSAIYIRVYIKYCIISSDEIKSVEKSPILFSENNNVSLNNIKLGEWRNGYFNIEVLSLNENCGIQGALFDDYFHDVRVVK